MKDLGGTERHGGTENIQRGETIFCSKTLKINTNSYILGKVASKSYKSIPFLKIGYTFTNRYYCLYLLTHAYSHYHMILC